MTGKYRWREIKESIKNILQLAILSISMTTGFWLIYCLIWCAFALPTTNWALFGLFILATVTEILYIEWIHKD